MVKVKPGYIKANSHNIPVVDIDMFTSYLKADGNFISPEIRCVRAVRSGRESYGDSAIGYVQLKRDNEGLCTVLAAVAPEHNVRSKAYEVQIDVDVRNNTVMQVKCHDCVASQGGCKHGLAFLGWLYRKSESPTVTDVDCYWKKSRLSRVGTTLKWVETSSLGRPGGRSYAKRPRKITPAGSFLAEVIEDQSMKWDQSDHNAKMPLICRHFLDDKISWFHTVELHQLYSRFKKTVTSESQSTFKRFLAYCQRTMKEEACLKAQQLTCQQSKCPEWFKLRWAVYFFIIGHNKLECQNFFFTDLDE